MVDEGNFFLNALMSEDVEAVVVDFDHYRIHGGMAVETDYIIAVTSKSKHAFEDFKISKTYSAFRTLASQLKKAAESSVSNRAVSLSTEGTKKTIQFVESVEHLVDSQRTEYLGKVNYNYVKSLAKQRAGILNNILELLVQNFPKTMTPTVRVISRTIETFFLTDHCMETTPGGDDMDDTLLRRLFVTGGGTKKKTVKSEESAVRSAPLSPTTTTTSSSPPSLSPSAPKTQSPPPRMIPEPLAKKMDRGTSSGSRLGDKEDVVVISSPVVPLTRKSRRSLMMRVSDDEQLQKVGSEANLLLDDDRTQAKLVPSYSDPVPTVHFAPDAGKLAELMETSPLLFLGIFCVVVVYLKLASYIRVKIDMDIALLVVFSFFCIGLHMPRPSQQGIDTPPVAPPPPPKYPRRSASFVLRKSFQRSATPTNEQSTHTPANSLRSELGEIDEEDGEGGGEDGAMLETEMEEGTEDPLIVTPMPVFPEGAELGSHFNCWSEPSYSVFKVRGQNYLKDKKKIPSGPYLFPVRGTDLFLTDACPENIGTNSGIFGGALREKPTFLINFRLPWGVFVFYFELHEKFVPFVRKRYEEDFNEPLPSLDSMTPSNRTLCRWLLGDDKHKNTTLKIVPVVVKGPWVVKSVVGGKPAIIGNKLPVTYVYQPAEGNKALYLEADMDVVASSAARGILSVVRSYTQGLTLDLGFVIQGNTQDELPEQMMGAVRCHGLDPMNASPLPPMKQMYEIPEDDESM